jgi:hypothetical protein
MDTRLVSGQPGWRRVFVWDDVASLNAAVSTAVLALQTAAEAVGTGFLALQRQAAFLVHTPGFVPLKVGLLLLLGGFVPAVRAQLLADAAADPVVCELVAAFMDTRPEADTLGAFLFGARAPLEWGARVRVPGPARAGCSTALAAPFSWWQSAPAPSTFQLCAWMFRQVDVKGGTEPPPPPRDANQVDDMHWGLFASDSESESDSDPEDLDPAPGPAPVPRAGAGTGTGTGTGSGSDSMFTTVNEILSALSKVVYLPAVKTALGMSKFSDSAPPRLPPSDSNVPQKYRRSQVFCLKYPTMESLGSTLHMAVLTQVPDIQVPLPLSLPPPSPPYLPE